MKHLLKAASTLFCVAAMTTILSTGARADMWDRYTTVTFGAPVEIPGVHLKGYRVLPAGTYVFELMDSSAQRHIVQIFTKDKTKCLATIMAIPNVRLKPPDKTVITFRERANGQPPALRAWFYPGSSIGDEFVYGKKEAKEIATATQTPVLYNNTDTDENTEVTAPIQRPQPEEVKQMDQAEVKSYSPAGEEQDLSAEVEPPPAAPVQMAQNTPPAATPTPAPAPAQTPASSTSSQLPQTASPLGWIMLSGLLSLCGGLGVKLMRQSSR